MTQHPDAAVGAHDQRHSGPATSAAWNRLHEAAATGAIVDGVPDYLDVERQREIAFDLLRSAHDEIHTLHTRVGGDASAPAADGESRASKPQKKFTRRQRFRSATRRLRAGKLSVLGYVRTCLWITFKSHRIVDEPASVAAPARDKGAGEPATYAAIKDLIAVKKYDHAYVWARSLRRKRVDAELLELLIKINIKRGNISSALADKVELATLKRKPDPSVRLLEGRLRELTGWIPQIPGPSTTVEPAAPNIVLHLVKESRPYLSNGFTSRSHHNFLAEKAAGLEPVIVTEPGFPRQLVDDDVRDVEYVDGIAHHRLDLGAAEHANEPVDAFLERFAFLAYQRLLETRPAVIHASSGRRGFETALVGLALKEKTGLPLVYEVRSFFESNWTPDTAWEGSGEVFLRRRAVEAMCMERADFVLTLGESMRAELVRAGIPAEKITIIPNGVDFDDFDVDAAGVDTLRTSLGLEGLPTFGYVSNMDHYRESQETLVRACAILRDRGSEMRCVLVGGGRRMAAIKNLAERLGVADRVIFTGPVDHADVPSYYGLIDLFVVPRISERAATYVTPLKPYEAMAMSRPVITSDLPALREIVDPPHRGLTFAHDDPAALADVLQTCVADPDLVSGFTKRGFEWVRAERQWEYNGPRYRAVFDALAAKGE